MDWREGIDEFDRELSCRMRVIVRYEVTGVDWETFERSVCARAMGFPDRKYFPWWRDSAEEWQYRNIERVRAGRLRWYSRHKAECAVRHRRWVDLNRDGLRVYHREYMRRYRSLQHPLPPLPLREGEERSDKPHPLRSETGVQRSRYGSKVLGLSGTEPNVSTDAGSRSTLRESDHDRQ